MASLCAHTTPKLPVGGIKTMQFYAEEGEKSELGLYWKLCAHTTFPTAYRIL